MKSTNDVNSWCCTYSNLANKKENERGITLIALVITTIFSYDENIRSSNSKGFLLHSI